MNWRWRERVVWKSSEQSGHRVGLDELARLVEVIVDGGFGVDAQRVVNGGENLSWVNGLFGRRGSGGVRFAIKSAALDASTGNQARIAIRPMIAAVRGIAVAGRTDSEAR